MPEARRGAAESPAKQRLEAIASIIGAALALGTLGVILWEGFRGDKAPPFVTVRALGVSQVGEGFVVEVEASNAGDRTAAQVLVEGEVTSGAATAISEATFDYVPARSTRRGGLFFAQDPRRGELRLRALGFANP